MSFINDIPAYKSYSEEKYIMHSSPDYTFWNELRGLAQRIVKSEDTPYIKSVLDKWAEYIPCKPTDNWGFDFFLNDMKKMLTNIEQKVDNGKFDVLMDCLSALIGTDKESIRLINEFLAEHRIGYYYNLNRINRYKIILKWCTVEDSNVIDKVISTSKELKTTSQQAYEEMNRAVVSLEYANDERARKDAVRSCVSAMEAIIKEYGKSDEIKQASKNLREEKIWGLDDIVKQGYSIFTNLHRLYPDLRHGSKEISSMSIEETEYWIGLIQNYILFMKKMADKIGYK